MRLVALAMLVAGCAATTPVTSFGHSKQASTAHCTRASECELVSRSCCGHCGAAAPGDVRAVLTGTARRPARCAGMACPRCHADTDPALIATCSHAGECGVIDLSSSPLTACESDAQCVVVARDCCECGASAWVAVRGSAADTYRARVCASDETCPACVGAPVGHAVCRAHHCAMSE